MSQNGHDDTAPVDPDEPQWATHVEHAMRLDDDVARGVALESIERDRLTFEDRKRFLERYEHDQKEARRDRGALAGGLSNVLREQKAAKEQLDFAVALMSGIAAKVGVTETEVGRLREDARTTAHAQKIRDTAVERTHALMRARLEEMARRLTSETARAAQSLASAEDSTQRAAVTAAIAADALERLRDANVEAARATAERDVERDARKSLTTEITVTRTETRARQWSLREKIMAAVALSLVGGGGVVARWLWTKLTEK